MIVATILAKLEANADNMVRNAAKGSKAIDSIGDSAKKSGAVVDSSMKKIEKATQAVDREAVRLSSTVTKTYRQMGSTAEREAGKAAKATGSATKAVERNVDAVKKAEAGVRKYGTVSDNTWNRSTALAQRNQAALAKFTGGGGPIPAMEKGMKRVEAQNERTSLSFQKVVNTGLKIGAVIGITTFAAQAFSGAASAVIEYNQALEQARIGLGTMLGDQEKANQFLAELQEYAAKTPFSFRGLVSATQSMMALGFASEDVLPNLTAVGDATAALGGSMEDMGARVIRALGQMRAKGKVSAEEMMQLAEAGIPAWQYLADAIGMEIPDAMETAKKTGVDAAVAIDAIMKGMESDFGGMMAKQSETMMGSWSTVLDYLQMNVAKATKPIFDEMKGGIQGMAEYLGSPAATEFAEKFTKKVGDAFASIKTLLGPPIADAVDLARDLGKAGGDVAGHLKSVFRVAGAVVVGAFKGLEAVIGVLDSMVTFIDKNEWAAKALAVAITAVVASMAAGKVIAFWGKFTDGVSGALGAVKAFTRTSGDAYASIGTMKRELDAARSATDALSTGGRAKIAALEGSIASATQTSVGFKNGIKNAGSNLMAAFGGPAGIAVTGAIALIGWKLNDAAKKAQEFESRVKSMEDRMKAALEQVDGPEGTRILTTEDRTRVVIDEVYNNDSYENLRNTMDQVGLSAATMSQWVIESNDVLTLLDKTMDDLGATGEGSGRSASMFTNALKALADSGGDVEAALDNLTGSENTALRYLVNDLEAAGISAEDFINSDLGKELDRIASSTEGLDDAAFNTLFDSLSDVTKAYQEGVLSSEQYEQALNDIADEAKRNAETVASTSDGFRSINGAIKIDEKVLTENSQKISEYVTDVTNTWNGLDLDTLSEQMGLDDFEKDMKERLERIANWSNNLQTLINAGADPALLNEFITQGPGVYGRIVDELARNTDRLPELNELWQNKLDVSGTVADLTTQTELIAQITGNGSNFMRTLQWAADNGVDLFKEIAEAPEGSRLAEAWKAEVEKASNTLKLFLSGDQYTFKGTGVDLLSGFTMDPEAFKLKLTNAFDATMATMPELQVAIDADPVEAKKTFTKFVEEVASTEAGVSIDGYPDEATAAVRGLLDLIDEANPELDIYGDPTAAGYILNTFLASVDTSTGTVGILADPIAGAKALKAFTATVDETTGTLTIDGTPVPADSELNSLKDRIDETTGTIIMDANEQAALDSIRNVKQEINSLPLVGSVLSRMISNAFDTPMSTGQIFGSANGNIFKAFADGGMAGSEHHVAQIAPGGAWRLWAEPETGGEAYIPLAHGKRGRSMDILRQVADMFGQMVVSKKEVDAFEFAEGGVFAPATVDVDSMTKPVYKGAESIVTKLKSMMSTPSGGGNVTGINPMFLSMFNMYNSSIGNVLRIVSGWRSSAQQAVLYAKYLAGIGNVAAPPGRSNHERGLAIDHAPHSTAAMRGVASSMGLKYPMSYEPWHVEPYWAANGGILSKMGAFNGAMRMATYDTGGVLWPGYTMAYNGTGEPEYVSRSGDGGNVSTVYNINGDLDERMLARIRSANRRRDRKLARSLRKR